MTHANARLTPHGRRLLVERVINDGRPVAHVAKELGVSQQCAHRWVARYRAEGPGGLLDRSSRPQHYPRRTSTAVEQAVLQLRREERRGQDWIGPELGIAPRTVSTILRRHKVPYLRECDPLTGEVIRASKTTARRRYERPAAGDLVHIDVKKVGKLKPAISSAPTRGSESTRSTGLQAWIRAAGNLLSRRDWHPLR